MSAFSNCDDGERHVSINNRYQLATRRQRWMIEKRCWRHCVDCAIANPADVTRYQQSIVKAFKVYVRPLLEYNSSIWSPSLKKDIEIIENVQRRFTKRVFGLSAFTYYQRLVYLGLESLELRRLRNDLLLTYKILFGLTGLDSEDFFKVNIYRNQMNLRGHAFQIIQTVCNKSTRSRFFASRIVGVWNNLPCDSVNFSSIATFRTSLTTSILAPFCKVNFN